MTDRERRRALRDAWKAGQRRAAWERLGLDREQLDGLLGYLDEQAGACDHSLRHSRAWAAAQGLDWPVLEGALRDAGGGCDCEVAANVDPDESC